MIRNVGDERFYAALEDCKEDPSLHDSLQIRADMIGKSCVKHNYWIADCRKKLKAVKFEAEKTGILRDIGITG